MPLLGAIAGCSNGPTPPQHTTMAPRPLPQSWSSPSPPNDSTLQWHPTMAPSNGTHVHSPKVGWHPPPTIAHYNGTLQWHHVHSPKVGRHTGTQPLHTTMAPRPLPQSWPSPSPPPTIAHYNGTLVPRPIRQSGSSPSPGIGSKNPIAIAIWGKTPSKPLTVLFNGKLTWNQKTTV